MPTTSALRTHVINTANQPDLRGNLAPVGEGFDTDSCPVTGQIPEGLRGTFVRNGPNPMFEPIGRYHMFDGDGMLHGITFTDDGVSYRNRWIQSRGLGAEIAHGSGVYPGLGEVMNFPDASSPATPVRSRTRQIPISCATPANTWRCGRAACPRR